MKNNNPCLRIMDIAPEERPRERLFSSGANALSNAELLAIIIGSGSTDENAIELSKKMLSMGLLHLAGRRPNFLRKIKGIGEAKASRIAACFELGKRLNSSKAGQMFDAKNAKSVAMLFMAELSHLKKEHLRCIFLNSRKRIISYETIFIGSLNASVIHPREIFSAAFEESAAAIILLHNHPSGSPQPSEEDIEITKQLLSAGKILGIELVDHIIIGNKNYFSFGEKGYL